MKESSVRKPFRTRLIASLFIWLLIAFLLGLVGFIMWLTRGRDEHQRRGAYLPPFSELFATEGKILETSMTSGKHSSPSKVEFQVNGQTFQFQTIDRYGLNSFPFQPGQKVEVLYLPHEPEKAWLKWEYERVMEDYPGISKGMLIEKIKGYYGYFVCGVLAISGIFLLINLFFPVLRALKGTIDN